MKYVYSMSGAQQMRQLVPLYGAGTTIAVGAAINRGVTAGTNQGYGIIGVPTYATFWGVTEAAFAAATLDNDPTTGTKYYKTPLCTNPDAVYACDYDTTFGASGLTIASGTTTPTITSLEAVDGGWLIGDDGSIRWIISISTGAATLKTASPWTTANKVIKIFPLSHNVADLTTAGTKLKESAAAAGTGKIRILANFIKAAGLDNVELDPTKHDNIKVSTTGLQVYAHIMFQSPLAISAT